MPATVQQLEGSRIDRRTLLHQTMASALFGWLGGCSGGNSPPTPIDSGAAGPTFDADALEQIFATLFADTPFDYTGLAGQLEATLAELQPYLPVSVATFGAVIDDVVIPLLNLDLAEMPPDLSTLDLESLQTSVPAMLSELRANVDTSTPTPQPEAAAEVQQVGVVAREWLRETDRESDWVNISLVGFDKLAQLTHDGDFAQTAAQLEQALAVLDDPSLLATSKGVPGIIQERNSAGQNVGSGPDPVCVQITILWVAFFVIATLCLLFFSAAVAWTAVLFVGGGSLLNLSVAMLCAAAVIAVNLAGNLTLAALLEEWLAYCYLGGTRP